MRIPEVLVLGVIVCAASACGGGGGNAGGDAGVDASAGEACVDDLGVLVGSLSTLTATVTETCVFGTGGCLLPTNESRPECIARCLETEIGLEQDCGVCIGLYTDCIISECPNPCMTNQSSPECAMCIEVAACGVQFENCAGFPIVLPSGMDGGVGDASVPDAG